MQGYGPDLTDLGSEGGFLNSEGTMRGECNGILECWLGPARVLKSCLVLGSTEDGDQIWLRVGKSLSFLKMKGEEVSN